MEWSIVQISCVSELPHALFLSAPIIKFVVPSCLTTLSIVFGKFEIMESLKFGKFEIFEKFEIVLGFYF